MPLSPSLLSLPGKFITALRPRTAPASPRPQPQTVHPVQPAQAALSAASAPGAQAMWGTLLLVAAVACFSVLDTTTQRITMEVPILMAVWARNVFHTIVTSALVRHQRRDNDGVSLWKTEKRGMHLLRGVLMLTVTLTAFLSLKYMPVGEFTAIVMTTPLLVTLLAARLLGEHVSIFRVLLVLGGFAGTLVIVRPGADSMHWVMLLPMLLVLANTAFQLLTSRLARTENPLTIQLYTSWIGTLLMTASLYWYWAPVTSISLWVGMLLMGTASAVGHFLLVMAFQRSPAAALMPYMYVQIGFSMFGGWLVFHHMADHWSLLGIAMIAICGVAGAILTQVENRLRARGLAAAI